MHLIIGVGNLYGIGLSCGQRHLSACSFVVQLSEFLQGLVIELMQVPYDTEPNREEQDGGNRIPG
jgi:hypothetical protein